ncbi:hypothetical protein [Mesomycoplasma lagogenitalium]|uniref:DUF2813 domain-containing protein n=1 Tax=Mesomycoplasma lagogenitalium TaxID=171286 RepID=A0ABY8LVA7_9BACT|nr:hypothetical protein [Mesomycoplasma lagogenitalium]WGI36463.1 hypothetical protein QEG99_03290 [Mesomycoplasma lagogenitalium]
MKIKQIKLIDFKGVSQYINNQLNNGIDEPTFSGKNASGKSSKLEAITYLLGNKKNLENKTFNIQSKLTEQPPYISLLIEKDGIEYSIEFNNDNYLINNKIYKVVKFREKITELLNISGDLLHFLCVPSYFASLNRNDQKTAFINIVEKVWFNNYNHINLFDEPTLEQLREKHFLKREQSKSMVELKKLISKKIKEVKAQFDVGFLGRYKDNFNKPIELLENELITADKNLEHLITVAINIKNDYKNAINESQLIESLNSDLILFNQAEINVLKEINKKILEHNFNFQINFLTSGEDEGELIITDLNNVEYKDLNRAEKVILGTEISLFFQKLLNVNLFLIYDDFEHLDDSNKMRLKEITKNNQVITAKVDQ